MSNDLMVKFEGAPDQVALIKQTVCKGATDQELALFLYTAKRTGLDPLLRQIYAVKRWDNKLKKETMAMQTGIDGLRLIADRTGTYAGNDEPIYEYDQNDVSHPIKASVTVYKIVAGQRCAFSASARWTEYCPKEGMDFMWKRMSHVMLGKCAEALALRKAFPAEIAGLYTAEEMAQAGPAKDADPVDMPRKRPSLPQGEPIEPEVVDIPEQPETDAERPIPAKKGVVQTASELFGGTPVGQDRPTPAGYKMIQAKFDGLCRGCGTEVKKGSEVAYSSTKGIYHPDCVA
jgi:phage recombination protein Bet